MFFCLSPYNDFRSARLTLTLLPRANIGIGGFMSHLRLSLLGRPAAVLGAVLLLVLPVAIIKGLVVTLSSGVRPFASAEMTAILHHPLIPITLLAGVTCLLVAAWLCRYRRAWQFWGLLCASLVGLLVVPVGLALSAFLLVFLLYTRDAYFNTRY